MQIQQLTLSIIQQNDQSGSTWSEVASLISTIAWSVSFYGQVWENYKYKNVEGFSLNYLFLNIIGYTFYGIYSTVGYFYPDVKGAGTVLLGDLIFVYHAIPIVIVQAIQCCYYPKGKNKISLWAKVLGEILIFVAISEFLFTVVFNVFQWTQLWNPVSCLGYGKLVISFLKYSPAVYWNWKRKSTKGWSIFNILLDFMGGAFSLASGSVSLQNGLNVAKLFLAILTVFYDLIFIIQHYVLYRKKDFTAQEQKLINQDLVTIDESNKNQNSQIQKQEDRMDQRLLKQQNQVSQKQGIKQSGNN